MLYEGLKVLKTMMVTAALSATLVVGADAAELKRRHRRHWYTEFPQRPFGIGADNR